MGVFNYAALKSVIRQTLEDRATVTIRDGEKMDENFQTVPNIKVIYKSIPCRLSRGGVSVTPYKNIDENVGSARLYTMPETYIPDGARIVVTKAGKEWRFIRSANVMRYESHNEYDLELDGGNL